MQRKAKKLLWDMDDAAGFLIECAGEVSLDRLLSDRMLRSAVERSFEILGEAARRLHASDPATAAHFSELSEIIGLRNVIAHNYDDLDYEKLLSIIQTELQPLRDRITALIPDIKRS
jgi:uncharacterized protein with HEPN domain